MGTNTGLALSGKRSRLTVTRAWFELLAAVRASELKVSRCRSIGSLGNPRQNSGLSRISLTRVMAAGFRRKDWQSDHNRMLRERAACRATLALCSGVGDISDAASQQVLASDAPLKGDVDAVENIIFGTSISRAALAGEVFFTAKSAVGSSAATRCSLAATYRPVVHQLLDVVHQAVELPLRVDLASASQGEPVQLFVVAQIAEHLCSANIRSEVN